MPAPSCSNSERGGTVVRQLDEINDFLNGGRVKNCRRAFVDEISVVIGGCRDGVGIGSEPNREIA
ncbi:UNVERIFIED_CONTAM: hypothetical protein Sradi_4341000 [Sesamum radiatum]|uniref:Uncharacterized protein n=1 Tax=Sesamum radiatum TaxID=300843 RepID=A0AAW2NNQ2_SESRA